MEPHRIERIKVGVKEDLGREVAEAAKDAGRQTARKHKLESARKKTLDAYQADALPLDVLKVEMDRITREMADADALVAAATISLEDVYKRLDRALQLTESVQDQYKASPNHVRRMLNQGIFTALYIDGDGNVTRAELADVFASLMAADLIYAIENPRATAATARKAAETEMSKPGWLRRVLDEGLSLSDLGHDALSWLGSKERTLVALAETTLEPRR